MKLQKKLTRKSGIEAQSVRMFGCTCSCGERCVCRAAPSQHTASSGIYSAASLNDRAYFLRV
ncbi:MAG: hypothetical protein WAX04_10560 [Oscillospiraceae bacterium]